MTIEALTPDEIDDLARRAQQGDRDALEALLAAVRPRVLNVCRGVLPHLPDAEDACQEALINISRNNSELSKTNRVIENGRFALQLLAADVAHAGFWGGYLPAFTAKA